MRSSTDTAAGASVPRPIQTVTGEISPDDLGFVLPHEHVFHDLYAITMNSQMILSDKRVALAGRSMHSYLKLASDQASIQLPTGGS